MQLIVCILADRLASNKAEIRRKFENREVKNELILFESYELKIFV